MVGPDKFYFNVRNLSGSEARGKMQYIERDARPNEPEAEQEKVPVYNRAGRPMSESEKERFIAKAERRDYCQRWQLTPPNGNDLSREELVKETSDVAHGYTEDKRTSTVAYSVHENSEKNNVHVLIAGDRDELRMDRDDIKQTRTNAHERMTANERYRQREQEQQQERERRETRKTERGIGR